MRKYYAVVTALTLMLLASQASQLLTWNSAGHMVSGAIANAELKQSSPQTLEKIIAVLSAPGDTTAYATNRSTPTLCAEEDNVNIPFWGKVDSFAVEATHPTYDVGTDNCGADFSNCSPSNETTYTFSPGRFKLFDDGETVVEAVREDKWWRPNGMTVSVNILTPVINIHYVVISRKIIGVNEWPQFFVLYMDGNLRLIPHPPVGRNSVCFGSSVIIGPAPLATRPIAEITSVKYISTSKTMEVTYKTGGSAILSLKEVNRSMARVQVAVKYPTDTMPFTTFRSMYIDGTNADVSRVNWKDTSGGVHDDAIMTFQGGTEKWIFYRSTRSRHNSSAPDITIQVFAGIPGPIGISVPSLTFDTTTVGDSSQKTFTISNPGSAALLVTKIVIVGADASQFVVSTTTDTIGAGGQQTISVTFAPTSAGSKSDTLTVKSNDPANPTKTIILKGVARDIVPGPVSLDLNVAEGDQGRTTKRGVKPDSTVSIQIFVKNAPAISGYGVRLEFDPTMLKFGSFTPSDFIPDKLPLTTQRLPNIVDVSVGNLSGATRSGSGLLGTIIFQATDKFSKETRIVASRVVFNQPTGSQEIMHRFIITLTDKKLPCPDFNLDGFVDFSDFFLFARAFGTPNPEFDLNDDGFVDFEDFFIFANAFGKPIKC